jgi:hypothetical protein
MLIAACFGAPRCFDFFFSNQEFPPRVPRLHKFAYQGGNLHIINLVHIHYGPRKDKVYELVLWGHFEVFLFVVAVYLPSYRLPDMCNSRELVKRGCALWRVLPWLSGLTIAGIACFLMTHDMWGLLQDRLEGSGFSNEEKVSIAGCLLRKRRAIRRFREYDWFVRWLVGLGLQFWARLFEQPRETIQLMVMELPELFAARANDDDCPTMMHYAVKMELVGVIRVLNEIPFVDPNEANSDGLLPVHFALAHRSGRALKALIQNPRIQLTGRPGVQSPLLAAIRRPFGAPFKFFRHPALDLHEEENGRMLLAEMIPAQTGLLFEELFVNDKWPYQVDINRIDGNRKTLLHYAAEMGSMSFLSRILKNPRFVPYIGESANVLFSFFWSQRSTRRLLK